MTKIRSRTLGGFLEELSSASATPGGGSVAALCGAISSGLGSMVCRLTANKKPSDELAHLLKHFTALEQKFLELADADETAFSAVMDAYHIDRGDERRPAMIAAALLEATQVPLRVAENGIDLLEHLCALAPLGSKQSVSDAGVAAHLAEAAVKSALLNVRINLAYMRDAKQIGRIDAVVSDLERKSSGLSGRAVSSVMSRITR